MRLSWGSGIGLVLVVASVLVLAMAVLGSGDEEQGSPPVQRSPVADQPADTTEVADGLSEGPDGESEGNEVAESEGAAAEDQTAAGAAAAAVTFLELSEEIVGLTPAEAGAMQRSISTSAAADELSAGVSAQMVELREAVPGGLTLWVAPIETLVTSTDDGYGVSIWYVEVLAMGGATASTSFKTISYQMVWENGWKSAGSTIAEGPTPAPTQPPTPELELVSLLEGFDDSVLLAANR